MYFGRRDSSRCSVRKRMFCGQRVWKTQSKRQAFFFVTGYINIFSDPCSFGVKEKHNSCSQRHFIQLCYVFDFFCPHYSGVMSLFFKWSFEYYAWLLWSGAFVLPTSPLCKLVIVQLIAGCHQTPLGLCIIPFTGMRPLMNRWSIVFLMLVHEQNVLLSCRKRHVWECSLAPLLHHPAVEVCRKWWAGYVPTPKLG